MWGIQIFAYLGFVAPLGLVAPPDLVAPLVGPQRGPPHEREAVWVFFADKGLDSREIPGALLARVTELSPRALARRARLGEGPVVSVRDLPPHPAYVRAVTATGARLRAESRWLNAVSVEATGPQRRRIASLPHVLEVRPVARGHRTLPLAAPPAAEPGQGDYGVAWEQLDMMGVPALHACGLDGAGVLVGVLDTGFTLEHVALAGVDVVAARDFIQGDDIVANEMGDPDGQDDHGSWVLAFLAGMDPMGYMGAAPGVSVLLAKTEDTSQEAPIEEDWFVEGLEWIEAQGADIATASLGYFDWYAPEDFDGQTAVTSKAASVAVDAGLIMFVAMGNRGPDPATLIAPADTDGVISVGATKLSGDIAGFSSRGPTADGRTKPDVVAPGAGVYTLDLATPDGYMTGNGTSFATPLAAGVGALLKQAYPNLGPATMRALLTSTASGPDMPDDTYGWGLIDAAAAGELYCTCTDLDGDFFFDEACGGLDCDDGEPAVHPGAAEICNGRDDDCDDLLLPDEVDADGDGVLACAGDCDDGSKAVGPHLDEVCDDGIDNDCDGLADGEDPACEGGGASTSGGTMGPGSDAGGGTAAGGSVGGTASASGTGETEGAGATAPVGGCTCRAGASRADGARPGTWGLLALLLGVGRRRRVASG